MEYTMVCLSWWGSPASALAASPRDESTRLNPWHRVPAGRVEEEHCL